MTNVNATAGGRSAALTWTRARQRWGRPRLPDHAVHRFDGADAHDDQRLAAGDQHDDHRAHRGTTYTFTVAGHQRRRHRPGLGGLQRRHPDRPGRARRAPPTSRRAPPRTSSVRLDRRPADGGSAIAGSTVTPYSGATRADAGPGRPATAATVTGLTNGTGYTFKVTATNAIGTGPVGASSAVTPPDDDLRHRHARRRSTAATPARSSSGSSSGPTSIGSVTGIRFYKAATNTGTHIGTLWSSERDQAGARRPSPTRRASGWQRSTFSSPVAVTANTTYVASYFAPQRPLLGHHRPDTARRQRAAARARPATSGNGVYAYGSPARSRPIATTRRTTSVDVVFTRPALRTQPTTSSATAGGGAANVTWTAPSSGGPVTAYTVTPYIGAPHRPRRRSRARRR